MKRVWRTACVGSVDTRTWSFRHAGTESVAAGAGTKRLANFQECIDTYIYGYPLLMFGVTERTGTTIANPGDRLGGAPLNQLARNPTYRTTPSQA